MPKISIIIPTIGRLSLKNTIESVLNQTLQDFEIIITDDTKDEKAKNIVLSYLKDGRVKYVVNKKYPRGPTGNKNNGLDYISGEYFTTLDDDDTLFEYALEKLIAVAEEKGYAMVFANCVDENGNFTGKHYTKSEEVSYFDMLSGKYDGEYFGINLTKLLGNNRFYEDCWGGENSLWWKLYKIVNKLYYLHIPVRRYNKSHTNRVIYHAISQDNLYKTFLWIKYAIENFGDDLIKVSFKQYLRYVLLAIYFGSVSDKRKLFEVLRNYILKKHFNVFLLTLPWLFFCTLFPKRFVRFIYDNLFRKFRIQDKVRNLFIKS